VLLAEPDVLLLDEPTNHLDAVATAWLEDFLGAARSALVMVTHDRYFLDRVVTRIVELDRGELHFYEGGYHDYLLQRAHRLALEQKAEQTRLNLLRRETEWMRRGPPARTTKAKARIDRYHDLADGAVEAGPGELEFSIPSGPRLGQRVIELHGVTKSFGERTIIADLDLEIGPGDRLGIVGPNGAGKSTLLRLCTGELEPDRGTVVRGATVVVAQIDQARSDLDPDHTVREEVAGPNDHVTVDGRAVRIEGFLERFLFPPKLQRTRVGDLSGGERNRVLLAKLLSSGGNVLVLDEPTNDLDLMTLRVLEEALIAFPGAALIVSHDRYFLDRVATRILYFDAVAGRLRVHEGDLSQLLDILTREERERAAAAARDSAGARKAPKPAAPAAAPRLTWDQKKELEGLPARIETAEAALADLDERLADPELYAGGAGDAVGELGAARARAQDDLDALYARWEELESIREAGAG
jgi:ATP-binding cassette subfamily F protein uup